MSCGHATTPEERAPRVAALLHDAHPEAVQALAEAGANALGHGDPASGPYVRAAEVLAARIGTTFAPDPPRFGEGDRVRHVSGGDLGRVTSRYLAESGGWEYQVRTPLGGRAFAESDLIAGRP